MNRITRALGALLLCAASCARAELNLTPVAVGVHLQSTHFRTPTDSCHPNNNNFGAFVRMADGAEVGYYYNSHCRHAFYAGHVWETRDFDFAGWPVRFELFATLITGYPSPFGAALGVSTPLLERDAKTRVRLQYTKGAAHSRGVAHLTLLHRF